MNELDILQELGLSQNEAKVYITLIKKHPLNGYEIAKRASITRTMVYDILKRLERKNVVRVIEGETKMYVPVDFNEILGSFREDLDKKISFLRNRLEEIASAGEQESYIINIYEYEKMVGEIRKHIESAKREIYLSLWAEEAELFKDVLKEAYDRGVKIYVFSFNKLPFDFGIHFTYNVTNVSDYFLRRRIIAVFDQEKLIVGEGNEKIDEISIVTSNSMIIQMAIDLLILDIAQLSSLKKGNYIKDNNTLEDYKKAIARYHQDIGFPEEELGNLGKAGLKT
ncbi:MAG TPA: helix-turn-helix domain-containing protein [Clostridia bacterium]